MPLPPRATADKQLRRDDVRNALVLLECSDAATVTHSELGALLTALGVHPDEARTAARLPPGEDATDAFIDAVLSAFSTSSASQAHRGSEAKYAKVANVEQLTDWLITLRPPRRPRDSKAHVTMDASVKGGLDDPNDNSDDDGPAADSTTTKRGSLDDAQQQKPRPASAPTPGQQPAESSPNAAVPAAAGAADESPIVPAGRGKHLPDTAEAPFDAFAAAPAVVTVPESGVVELVGGRTHSLPVMLASFLEQYEAGLKKRAQAAGADADDDALAIELADWRSFAQRDVGSLLVGLCDHAVNDPDKPNTLLLKAVEQETAMANFTAQAEESDELNSSVFQTASQRMKKRATLTASTARMPKRKVARVTPFVSILAAQHLSRSPSAAWDVDTALVFIDISGYSNIATALAKIDPFELSRVVNDYFGRLLTVVRRSGGDIVKFAGDAVVCAWHNSGFSLSRNLRAAIACTVELLTSHSRYNVPPVGSFGLHAGIAVGTVRSMLMIPPVSATTTAMQSIFHFICGRTLGHVSRACDLAARGEIVIHEAAVELMATEQGEHPLRLEPLKPEAGMTDDELTARRYQRLVDISVEKVPAAADSGGEGAKSPMLAPPTHMINIPGGAQEFSSMRSTATAGESPKHGDGSSGRASPDASAFAGGSNPRAAGAAITSGKYDGHFVLLPQRPRLTNVAHTWYRRQGDPLASCVVPATASTVGDMVGHVADELLFVPPRVAEQLAIGTDPLMMAQMRDLVVLFVRMGDSQCDASADVEQDPTAWFLEAHLILRSHGCAVIQVIDDDKGVHIVAAFGLYNTVGDAADKCIECVTQLRDVRSRSFVGAAAGNVFCGVLGHRHACSWDISGAACVRACRLMQNAVTTSTSIVLDRSVYELATDRSSLMEGSQPVTVKGSPRPVKVYHVAATAVVAAHQAALTPSQSGHVSADDVQSVHSAQSVDISSRLAQSTLPSADASTMGPQSTLEQTASPGTLSAAVAADSQAATTDPHTPAMPSSAVPLSPAVESHDQVRGPAPILRGSLRRSTHQMGVRRAKAASQRPPKLHFAHTLSQHVLVAEANAVRGIVEKGCETSGKRTVIIRGPPCVGKFGVLLNAVSGTGAVPVVHTAQFSQAGETLTLAASLGRWFAVSINRHVSFAALVLLEHLEERRYAAAFDAAVDLLRIVASRRLRVAIIIRRLQYLDPSSLSLLRVLHAEFVHVKSSAISLLVTCNPIPNVEAPHTFLGLPGTDMKLLQDNTVLSQNDGAWHMYLETVPEKESSAIVCHCLNSRVEDVIIDWIFKRACGVMGWIVELCHYLARRGYVLPTSSGTLTVRLPVRNMVEKTSWNIIAPEITVRVMQNVDQLGAAMLVMCKIVAAITEQPGISAFYYSVNRVTQVIVGRDLDSDDIKYLERLYLLRETEHKCTAHKGGGELDAAVFFIPPMRDVIAGLLTPTQRVDINAVCASAFADTHPMNHPMQYLVRARHHMFAGNQEAYEKDIASGWRMILKDFSKHDGAKIKTNYFPWMTMIAIDILAEFMSDKDLRRLDIIKRQTRVAGQGLDASVYSGGTAPMDPSMLLDDGASDAGGAFAAPTDVPDAESDNGGALDLSGGRKRIGTMVAAERSLALGPARSFLTTVLIELQSLLEALQDAEERRDELDRQMDAVGHDHGSSGESSGGEGHSSSSGLDDLNRPRLDLTSPAIPATVIRRFKTALRDYRIILEAQAEPMETIGLSTEDERVTQAQLNSDVREMWSRVSQDIEDLVGSDRFGDQTVEILQRPPSDETLEPAFDMVSAAMDLLTRHVDTDLPQLERLYTAHDRRALLHTMRSAGSEITCHTDDALGAKTFHVKRVERVRSEDEVEDGIIHAVDAFQTAGENLAGDASTLVVLYSHMPSVLEMYCKSSPRLREAFVEGLRGFYESMFEMETVRRRLRANYIVFMTLWVSCCRAASMFA